MYLSDGSCKAGYLVDITDRGRLLPKKVHSITDRGQTQAIIIATHQGSETPLTYPVASHPHTRGAPQWDPCTQGLGFEKRFRGRFSVYTALVHVKSIDGQMFDLWPDAEVWRGDTSSSVAFVI
ncbi:hypothetical protein AVEN_184232-1 [Araneus ventricosus]|uniref:Uncharacterized protein n=1 Tax=Araneus ventricosus TaxID=182803 RepID=A0A4Y2SPW4_ARAVE|nr:hypothetical protein AVEN_3507-1 [Araneus ventricosus]GBN90141.1 hypothetical protein AVEN_184232-1 [Araneus ventricosus]